MLSGFSGVWLFVTLWTVGSQAPLSMGFSRQEYWVVVPSSRGSPDPGIKSASLFPLHIGKWVLYHLRSPAPIFLPENFHGQRSRGVQLMGSQRIEHLGFLGGASGKEPICQCRTRDVGSIPRSGRSLGQEDP